MTPPMRITVDMVDNAGNWRWIAALPLTDEQAATVRDWCLEYMASRLSDLPADSPIPHDLWALPDDRLVDVLRSAAGPRVLEALAGIVPDLRGALAERFSPALANDITEFIDEVLEMLAADMPAAESRSIN